MVRQRRWAARRHASIHSGSSFLAEMKRTMSSDRPLGALSDSMSVTNPYLYWSTSRRRTRSTVSCTAGILPSAAVSRTAGGSVGYGRCRCGVPLPLLVLQAAMPRVSLSNAEEILIQAWIVRSMSDWLVVGPRLRRTAPRASSGGTPMAASTCEGWTLPEEQAAPDDT